MHIMYNTKLFHLCMNVLDILRFFWQLLVLHPVQYLSTLQFPECSWKHLRRTKAWERKIWAKSEFQCSIYVYYNGSSLTFTHGVKPVSSHHRPHPPQPSSNTPCLKLQQLPVCLRLLLLLLLKLLLLLLLFCSCNNSYVSAAIINIQRVVRLHSIYSNVCACSL